MTTITSRLPVAMVLALLGLVSCGCLPIKHTFRKAPPVDGRLTRGGQPEVGAAVHFGDAGEKGGCAAPRMTVTDPDGRFHIDAQRQRVYVAFVDRFPASSLCLQARDGAVVTW